MSSVLRPSTVDDEAQLVEFLARAFSATHDAPFLNRPLLRWKYWEPRPGWPEPRSLVIEKDGRIVAHAGLWPVTVRTASGAKRGVHMIDWASDPHAPGAGVSLLQRLTRCSDFVYSIGGSAMTQTILPKFGFRVCATAQTLARPIRPWRQILQHQEKDLRLPVRLVRNFWWSKSPGRELTPGWTAAARTTEETAPEELAAGRDVSFLRYLEQCPSARLLYFDILREGRKAGFFALSVVGQQARVAGLSVSEAAPDGWRTALHLLQQAALRHTISSELVIRTASEVVAGAASQAGMRLRESMPVFLFHKGEWGAPPLDFQMWDNDAVFLGSDRAEFLT